MKHFVVYHNPDSIGYPASEVSDLSIVTNKSITDEILGNKIWLITGEGQPRNYSIVAQFIANTVESGKSDGFTTRVKGHLGTIYKQMKSIDHCTWLPDFKSFFKAFEAQLMSKPIYLWVNCIRVMEEYGMSHVMDFYMVPELLKKLNVRSRTAFAGKLDLQAVDWDERWSLAARYDGHAWPSNFDGDFRDWDKIEDWATAAANDLQAVVVKS